MRYEYDVAIPGGHPPLTTGERRLMLATLEDAMRSLLGHRYGSRHARLQREDLDWLMSDVVVRADDDERWDAPLQARGRGR